MTSNNSLISVHGKLWYDEPGYRFAWFVLPQALVAIVLAALLWGAKGHGGQMAGQWGEPIDSEAHRRRLSELRDKAGKEGDKEALATLQKMADGGDLAAKYRLGTLYDPVMGQQWYSKAGLNDAAKAVELYNASKSVTPQLLEFSEMNVANLQLDSAYTAVFNTKLGCETAMKHTDGFLRDATANEGWILARVGDCFAGRVEQSGRVPADATADDLKTAFKLYKAAAQTGYANVFLTEEQLGLMYEFGRGTDKDLTVAKQYYESCAKKNSGFCYGKLGAFYRFGLGNTGKNDEMARKNFESGSALGDGLSHAQLASYYFNGEAGLARDQVKFVEYATKATEVGNPWGTGMLAFAYVYGQGNLKKDVVYGAKLFLKALDLKWIDAGNVLRDVQTSIPDREFWTEIQKGLKERHHWDGAVNGKPSEGLIAAAAKAVGPAPH